MAIQKQFTKEQKHMLIQCITDADIFGLSDKQGMKYVEEKTGRSISLTTYQRYKKIALNDESANAWINNFGKIGFVKHYRKRINEMEILQQTTFRQLNIELDKKPEEQDKKYVLSLMESIRQNNIHLSQMGNGMPIVAKTKELIQGGTYNSRVLELNGIRENPIVPNSQKYNNIEYNNEAEKKDNEEQEEREGEKEYQRRLKMAVF
jgi:hypothetical protein